jgi:hypothetical protein
MRYNPCLLLPLLLLAPVAAAQTGTDRSQDDSHETVVSVEAAPYDVGAVRIRYGDGLIVRESQQISRYSPEEFEKCFTSRIGTASFDITDQSISAGMDVLITMLFYQMPGFGITFRSSDPNTDNLELVWEGGQISFGGITRRAGDYTLGQGRVMVVNFTFDDHRVRLLINDGTFFNTEIIEPGTTYDAISVTNIGEYDCLYQVEIVQRGQE